MNFDDKIDRFHREVALRKASLALFDPLPFRFARRVGIRLPPPPFLPMWFNLALVFIALDVPLTLIAMCWPLLISGTPLVYLLIFSLLSTLASGAIALCLALAWRRQATRLRLPRWSRYGDA